MRIFDYELSHYELAIAGAVSLLIVLLILSRLPKWSRISVVVVLLAGGSLAFFWYQKDSGQAVVETAKEIQKAKKKKAPENVGGGGDFAQEATEQNEKVSSGPERRFRSFQSAPEAPADKQEKFETVDVLYGTDRTKSEGVKRISFSDGRGKQLHLGRATVTVPKKIHKTGEIERPFEFQFLWIKYSQKEDPEKHFTVHKIGALSRDEFASLSREMMSKSSRFKDQAFVFIHGYNVSFDSALYRTAQMAYDLGFDGVPYMYSWPSVGGLLSYEYDQNSAQQSRPYLREFLDIVTKESGAKNVHVIAHSMGNAPLMEVLRDLRFRPDADKVSNINQIILAAPDIDRDVFINLAQEIKGLGKGITLYVSSSDLAMKASRAYSGSIRAGDVPENGPIVIKGMDTIDVTKLSTSMFYSLNHALYADSSKILGDITKIMLKQIRPPHVRTPELTQVDDTDGTVFWRYNE